MYLGKFTPVQKPVARAVNMTLRGLGNLGQTNILNYLQQACAQAGYAWAGNQSGYPPALYSESDAQEMVSQYPTVFSGYAPLTVDDLLYYAQASEDAETQSGLLDMLQAQYSPYVWPAFQLTLQPGIVSLVTQTLYSYTGYTASKQTGLPQEQYTQFDVTPLDQVIDPTQLYSIPDYGYLTFSTNINGSIATYQATWAAQQKAFDAMNAVDQANWWKFQTEPTFWDGPGPGMLVFAAMSAGFFLATAFGAPVVASAGSTLVSGTTALPEYAADGTFLGTTTVTTDASTGLMTIADYTGATTTVDTATGAFSSIAADGSVLSVGADGAATVVNASGELVANGANLTAMDTVSPTIVASNDAGASLLPTATDEAGTEADVSVVTGPSSIVNDSGNLIPNVSQTWSDGTTLSVSSDASTITVTDSAGNISTIAADDGAMTVQAADGTVFSTAADGSSVETLTNGVVINQAPDGTITQSFSDGSSWTQYTDGTQDFVNSDGNTFLNADGSGTYTPSDGSDAINFKPGNVPSAAQSAVNQLKNAASAAKSALPSASTVSQLAGAANSAASLVSKLTGSSAPKIPQNLATIAAAQIGSGINWSTMLIFGAIGIGAILLLNR